MSDWTAGLAAELDRLEAGGRLRRLASHSGPNGSRIRSRGRSLLNFSSNNYLGLAQHTRVAAAAARAAARWGAGSGASRLLSGSLDVHRRLEAELAAWKKEEAALVYSSGYLTNLGVIPVLAGPGDLVLLDRLDHASLVDAARLSKAKIWVYPHRDADELDRLLERGRTYRRRLVVTDSYFSMDGDVAPLDRLVEVCRRREAMLYVDEAHATGVYGPGGAGLTEHFGLCGRIDAVMGTLSKALGSAGGYLAGRRLLVEWLVNRSRAFIYTTAPVPAASAAALEAVRLARRGPLRRTLWKRIGLLRALLLEKGFNLMGSEGPVVPVRAPGTRQAVDWAGRLARRGIHVPVIRPPTVPEGTDRLRISVSAAHSESDLRRLASALEDTRPAGSR